MKKEEWYCDRCGRNIPEWINTHGFHIHTEHIITTNDDEKLDLCQDCYDSLQTWWKNGKEEDPAHVTEPLAKIKGFNALVFDQNGLNKIKKVDEDFCVKYLQESGWMERYDRVLRRHEWIETCRSVTGDEYFVCPSCTSAYTTRTNYCPNCGLDLR